MPIQWISIQKYIVEFNKGYFSKNFIIFSFFYICKCKYSIKHTHKCDVHLNGSIFHPYFKISFQISLKLFWCVIFHDFLDYRNTVDLFSSCVCWWYQNGYTNTAHFNIIYTYIRCDKGKWELRRNENGINAIVFDLIRLVHIYAFQLQPNDNIHFISFSKNKKIVSMQICVPSNFSYRETKWKCNDIPNKQQILLFFCAKPIQLNINRNEFFHAMSNKSTEKKHSLTDISSRILVCR